MIPTFPNFKNLTTDDMAGIRTFGSLFPPYSDFNFISMYCYDTNNDFLISNLNGNLVVRFKEYESEEHFYSFLGVNKPLDTIVMLMEHSKTEGINQILKLVPEHSIKTLLQQPGESGFKISEDPANFDYIISVPKLISLKGRKIYSYKNLIRRFYKKYPDVIIKTLNLEDDSISRDIIKLFLIWAESKKKSDDEIKFELQAIKRLLSIAGMVELVSIGVYADNKLIGFSIEEVDHDGYAMAHFGKADVKYGGIYQVLEYESAKFLESKGCQFVNLEQDLGIEGLMRNKRNWDPVSYLKKYLIEFK